MNIHWCGSVCRFSPHEIYDPNAGLHQLWDYNDIHVLDFEPSLKTLSIMKVLENNIDMTWLPQNVK